MLQYKTQVLTIQGHPEFSISYIKALMKFRQAQYPADTYKKANQSLGLICHDKLIAQWMINFIQE